MTHGKEDADHDSKRPDETSIKPVSSLRSRFENLGLAATSAQTTPARPRPALPAQKADGPGPSSIRRSIDRGASSTNPVAGLGITQSIHTNGTPGRAPAPLGLSRISPPRVTIESPRSPPKDSSIRNASQSPSRRHSTTISTVTTPVISPRTSLSTFSTISARSRPNGPSTSAENLTIAELSPRATRSSRALQQPPPVNRAGKPNVNPSEIRQTSPFEGGMQDKAVSPFSTPPSSTGSSPNEPTSPLAGQPTQSRAIPSTRTYFMPLTAPLDGQQQIPELPKAPLSRTLSLPLSSLMGVPQGSDGSNERQTRAIAPSRSPNSNRSSPSRTPKIPSPNRTPRISSPNRTPRIPSPDRTPGMSSPNQPARMSSPRRAPKIPTRYSPDDEPDRRTVDHVMAPPLLPVRDQAAKKGSPPMLPAPRRSVETRRSIDVRRSIDSRSLQEPELPSRSQVEEQDQPPRTGSIGNASDWPDGSHVNRRPPRYPRRPWEISTNYDTRLFTVCGEYICSGGFKLRIWNIKTGELVYAPEFPDGIRVTALAWKPMKDVNDEGKRLWLGTSLGDIHEVDVPSKGIVRTRSAAHSRGEIVRIFRHGSELWSVDSEGSLVHWRSSSSAETASLDGKQIEYHIARGYSTSVVVGSNLWMASGKDIRVLNLTAQGQSAIDILRRPLSQDGAGEITCATIISSQPQAVYFGHSDGKVSVYDQRDYSCIGLFSVSAYKISAMMGIGSLLWAGYSTGSIFVYDTSTTPWTIKKEWRAHAQPVCGILADPSSIWKLDRFQVVSLGLDGILRIWDGMLEQDWLEDKMQSRDEEFCSFREVTAAVMTWNAGASKPSALRTGQRDSNFFRDYFSAIGSPDICIFGFQELIDLEDKKLTAKSFFKSKKKDSVDQEKMSHQYREWRDHLVRSLDDLMPSTSYVLLHAANLVGLFTCVFVKSSLRAQIKGFDATDVKRGMGGLHGNKGAIILRMILDDSSVCLVNCHLAAGQSQTNSRNNDIAAILESDGLPVSGASAESFVGGGDGTMIMDHEICIINGDLNYRIDAMTRDAVVRAVRENNLTKLIERDQLLLSKKRNPAFRLKLFQEMPITFAPTYKYNVGTTEYDTSEKKRSPAWCDRILFRGLGRVKCFDYRRWEVHVSDHRPVTAQFKMRIKTIDPARRDRVWKKTVGEYDIFRQDVMGQVRLDYLVNVLGIEEGEARRLLRR